MDIDKVSFKWATVTGLSPLEIKLDGDTAPLLMTPESISDPGSLSVDDRVRVELSRSKRIVHGRLGGDPRVGVNESDIAALDSRTSGVPYRQAAGFTASQSITSGGEITITYPVGRFTVDPVLQATLQGSARLQIAITANSTTGATVRADNHSGVNASGPSYLHWHAVQMESGSASG